MRHLSVAGLLLAGVLLAPRAGAAEPPAPQTPPGQLPVQPPGELPPIFFDAKNKLELTLHGSLWLWFNQPLTQLEDPRPGAKTFGPSDHFFEIYYASLEVGAKWDKFGLYINPRFRDTKSREFYTSNVWLQQAYLSYDAPGARIQVGKIENAFSRLGEDAWTASLIYLDGIKGETDYGISADGSFKLENGLSLAYYAHYFVTDGRTNISFPDRDTVWVDGAHRDHILVARVEPSYQLGKETSLRGGAAVEVFYVDLKNGTKGEVLRTDVDASLATGPLHVGVEWITQVGRSVTSYPFAPTATTPGISSAHNYYFLAGGGVRLWRFYPRYSFSLARYADVGVTEMIHVPGVTFVAHDNISILFEYSWWQRRDPPTVMRPATNWLLDSSLNLLLNGRF